MIIKNLKVENFRNIQSAEFEFSPKTNIFSGNNAQGKTNLVESVCAALENSFRTNKLSDMLNKNSDNTEVKKASIIVDFSVDNYPNKNNRLSCGINTNKVVRNINGIPYKEAINLYPQLKIIIFIPEDLYLVKGNPESRRALADETADMMNKVHHNMVNRYQKGLKQKNAIISRIHGIDSYSRYDRAEIFSWNEELAKAGVNVMVGRLKYFDTLSKYVCEYYKELNSSGEVLKMVYNSSIMKDIPYDINDVEKMFNVYIDTLQSHTEKEIVIGHTLVGVQRDDISFYINEKPVKDFASQGQIRSIAVALRLAQAQMFKEKWGESPIIVLDDVLSELDEFRRGYILQHITGSQVFITGCNEGDFSSMENSKRWTAENGKFTLI